MLVVIWFGCGNICVVLVCEMVYDKGVMMWLVDMFEMRGWVMCEWDIDDWWIVNLVLIEVGEVVMFRCCVWIIVFWNDWLKDWDWLEVEMLIGLL